jgi:hypothetical protein
MRDVSSIALNQLLAADGLSPRRAFSADCSMVLAFMAECL